MNRSRSQPGAAIRAQTRIRWHDGPFEVECEGLNGPMTLRIYHGGFLLAEEPVDSAQRAWQRSSEICRQLAAGTSAACEQGSA